MIYEFFRKPLGWAVGALIVVLLIWGVYSAITGTWRAKARLANNQAEAAQQTGKDAVNTVDQTNSSGRAREEKVHDSNTKVDAATDAAGADAAGSDGLCGLSADLCRK